MKKILILSGLLFVSITAFCQDARPIPIDVKNKSLDVHISNTKKLPVTVFNGTAPLNVHVVDTNTINVHVIETADTTRKIFSFVKTENLTNSVLIIPKPGFAATIEYIGFEGVDQSNKLQTATKAFISYYDHASVAPFDVPAAQFPVVSGNCTIVVKPGNAARINLVLPEDVKGAGFIYVYGHQKRVAPGEFVD